jgi:ATP phosphoribosyltransferase regulatory subunit
MKPAWLLPEYIEDILPPYAWQAETLRRRLLDLFDSCGYELVVPPLMEFLDSLLTGSARDLDLKTFKMVDGLSGRQMGVRADITPQTARIDAHLLNRQGVTRLCYAGPVLHTKPAGLMASREPIQIGAELFGHAGIAADREILDLLLAALKVSGLHDARVSLGHVGLFRSLAEAAGVDSSVERALFKAVRSKDVPELEALTEGLAEPWRAALRRLPDLYGDAGMLAIASRELPDIPGVAKALDELAALLGMHRDIALAVDLGDLRGYGYHNGAVFAAYTGGQAKAVALGGRYDGAGAAFGRARPATGFSLDLRGILEVLPEPAARPGILAPESDDAVLRARIAELRDAGERVVVDLAGTGDPDNETGCNRRLVLADGTWQIQTL